MSKPDDQPTTVGVRSMESKHVSLSVLRCKLVIVGDPWVGKSALTQVFSSGGSTYPKNYLMTVGAEFTVKQVPIPDTNVVVELYIFDCAGQSIFNQVEMNNKYYENASAVMVVYDVTSNESLQSCNKVCTTCACVPASYMCATCAVCMSCTQHALIHISSPSHNPDATPLRYSGSPTCVPCALLARRSQV